MFSRGIEENEGMKSGEKGYLQFIVLIFINFDRSVFSQEILYVAN